jgi:hypothetical protein
LPASASMSALLTLAGDDEQWSIAPPARCRFARIRAAPPHLPALAESD